MRRAVAEADVFSLITALSIPAGFVCVISEGVTGKEHWESAAMMCYFLHYIGMVKVYYTIIQKYLPKAKSD